MVVAMQQSPVLKALYLPYALEQFYNLSLQPGLRFIFTLTNGNEL